MRYFKGSTLQKAEATPAEVRHVALQLLARREHSALELRHKLEQRGFASAAINTALEELTTEDLLSDARFAEVYAHSRVDKGYGPLRIQRELRERGVSDEIVGVLLDELEPVWTSNLATLHRKRFAGILPRDAAVEAKQIRFLRHRGFTLEQIHRLFRGL